MMRDFVMKKLGSYLIASGRCGVHGYKATALACGSVFDPADQLRSGRLDLRSF
ncbi:MAG: hypothetical protein U5K38_03120 [Woeseiaceae bacterium]|nr:hypothetical protein [Woeseiaceae bacterium]